MVKKLIMENSAVDVAIGVANFRPEVSSKRNIIRSGKIGREVKSRKIKGTKSAIPIKARSIICG